MFRAKFNGSVRPDPDNNQQCIVTMCSMFTGKVHDMTLPMPEWVFKENVDAWEKGALIQDAFPRLSGELREFVKTGVTPTEWNEAFPPEEE